MAQKACTTCQQPPIESQGTINLAEQNSRVKRRQTNWLRVFGRAQHALNPRASPEQPAPPRNGEPATRPVTYRGKEAAVVTLSILISATDETGLEATLLSVLENRPERCEIV